jgi:hypothetical protein
MLAVPLANSRWTVTRSPSRADCNNIDIRSGFLRKREEYSGITDDWIAHRSNRQLRAETAEEENEFGEQHRRNSG